mmetsp:Transcript_32653/g.104012  ORF Transcript_32653/g.104012 Transcript_32653/m.104012 type:complete len:364 (-) Transcript_32653:177-1268(-)
MMQRSPKDLHFHSAAPDLPRSALRELKMCLALCPCCPSNTCEKAPKTSVTSPSVMFGASSLALLSSASTNGNGGPAVAYTCAAAAAGAAAAVAVPNRADGTAGDADGDVALATAAGPLGMKAFNAATIPLASSSEETSVTRFASAFHNIMGRQPTDWKESKMLSASCAPMLLQLRSACQAKELRVFSLGCLFSDAKALKVFASITWGMSLAVACARTSKQLANLSPGRAPRSARAVSVRETPSALISCASIPARSANPDRSPSGADKIIFSTIAGMTMSKKTISSCGELAEATAAAASSASSSATLSSNQARSAFTCASSAFACDSATSDSSETILASNFAALLPHAQQASEADAPVVGFGQS